MPNFPLSQKIAIFRQLHEDGALLLSNAWDAMTALLAEKAGAKAIITTSAGVAWTLGHLDGQVVPRKMVMQNAAAIAAATSLPMSIDIEDGLLQSGETMADLIADLLAVGAVGINIEDSTNRKSLDVEGGSQRIYEVRKAASAREYDLFINARIDAFLRGETRDAGDLIRRANAYFAAGADCVFIPGLADLDMCRKIATSIRGPLNVMALANGPSARELFDAGVTRISAGSHVAEAAYGFVLAQMRAFLDGGRLKADVGSHLGYGDINAIVARKH